MKRRDVNAFNSKSYFYIVILIFLFVFLFYYFNKGKVSEEKENVFTNPINNSILNNTFQCNDNVDNDNDGFIDLQDPGCINETDSTETLNSEYQSFTVQQLKQKFDSSFTTGQYSSSYFTEPYVAGLLSIYEATQDDSYINKTLDRVEFLTTNMSDLNNDGYKELSPPWCMGTENYNGSIMCSCLDVERGARQFTRLARIIKNDPKLNLTYGISAENIIKIVEHDIIGNPHCSDRYNASFDNGQASVYNIISHGAFILTELYLIDGNQTYKDIATAKAQSLKDNLFSQLTDQKALAWGTTLCLELNYTYPECYHDDQTQEPPCLDSLGHRYCSPSDTSHSEDFIAAAIEFYRAGIVFTKDDINSLSYTFLHKIWDKNITDPKYYDFIDGNLKPPNSSGQWIMGSNIAPGWVGLGAFDKELQRVVEEGDDSTITNKNWTVKMAYYGELARNIRSKDCQYTNNAKEICDNLDNDCDGSVDKSEDADGDGFLSCGGNVAGGPIDCVDTNSAINPLAEEICDGIDNNCNFETDEGCVNNPPGNDQGNWGGNSGNVGNRTNITQTINSTNLSAGCIESWNCSDYSDCINGKQERECQDENSCGTKLNLSEMVKDCKKEVDRESNEENDNKLFAIIGTTAFVLTSGVIVTFLIFKFRFLKFKKNVVVKSPLPVQ